MRIAGFTIIGLVTAAPVLAQSASQPIPRASYLGVMDSEFRKIDSNNDQKLVRAEIEQFQRSGAAAQLTARRAATFAQLDRDKNGQLSPAEFAAVPINVPAPDAGPLLTQLDLNKDQAVSLVEYRTVKLANFDKIDTDKDGVASVGEMKAAGIIK
jgi:hypothetical protein